MKKIIATLVVVKLVFILVLHHGHPLKLTAGTLEQAALLTVIDFAVIAYYGRRFA